MLVLPEMIVEKVKRDLAYLGTEHKVDVKIQDTDADSITFTVKVAKVDADGKKSGVAFKFRNYGKLFGVTEADYNRVINFRSRQYRVIDLHTSRPKYPFTVERIPDGKVFKFPVVPGILGTDNTMRFGEDRTNELEAKYS